MIVKVLKDAIFLLLALPGLVEQGRHEENPEGYSEEFKEKGMEG